MYNFFQRFIFYLKGSYKAKEETALFCTPVHSPSSRSGQSSADPKPGAFPGSLMWVQGSPGVELASAAFPDYKLGHKLALIWYTET